jgi:hypothetical protein
MTYKLEARKSDGVFFETFINREWESVEEFAHQLLTEGWDVTIKHRTTTFKPILKMEEENYGGTD